MNQDQIRSYLNTALDKGYDVQATLNSLMIERRGMAQIAQRNHEWATNSNYIFGVKTPDECLDPDYWADYCINIVKKTFWEQNKCVDDQHIDGHIYLPSGFSEEMESTFSHDVGSYSREDIKKMLTAAGFVHSQELEDWMKHHDP
jgi:hypothetical protein